ncbi:hypothetical protein BDV95DRAFT_59587 [Massariosphaeria phaeospora]|uniref:Uncharacterized protein n=1 Tax=Massariosphaeria phaeospora TaxID=100035 RepID=A0A7C8IDD7_9PLEO|nr:hypothetical protein BDV95DRAFT_59587 [Massariosphaeria phaeospora]
MSKQQHDMNPPPNPRKRQRKDGTRPGIGDKYLRDGSVFSGKDTIEEVARPRRFPARKSNESAQAGGFMPSGLAVDIGNQDSLPAVCVLRVLSSDIYTNFHYQNQPQNHAAPAPVVPPVKQDYQAYCRSGSEGDSVLGGQSARLDAPRPNIPQSQAQGHAQTPRARGLGKQPVEPNIGGQAIPIRPLNALERQTQRIMHLLTEFETATSGQEPRYPDQLFAFARRVYNAAVQDALNNRL